MDATLTPSVRRVPVRGLLELSIREWQGARQPPFVLVHGLASNARTWDGVAAVLNRQGHRVVAVDQRGHGLSDKPDAGYGFDEVTADLGGLIEALGLERPVLAGQSWGGNVVLEFAARIPAVAPGLVLVDGGVSDLSARPDATWERIAVDLRPPDLNGARLADMRERMRSFHPDWTDEGIAATLANFEHLPDGSVRPWLSLDRHMQILRALYNHKPADVYGRVATPTLIAVADNVGRAQTGRSKADEVERAARALGAARVHWFRDTAHDIHVHRPAELAQLILDTLADGFFGRAD